MEQGAKLAERIRQSVAKQITTHKGDVTLTVSIGLIDLGDEEPGLDIMHRLDKALYAAKGRGGNLVHVAGTKSPAASSAEVQAEADIPAPAMAG